MTNFINTTTTELIELKKSLSIDPVKFSKELAAINQELIIRELPFCRPLCDTLRGAN